ncbi:MULTISPECIES: MFS transporter [Metabacillus]|jgi:MFS transporter, DHA3 family, macrolide efflux protein|uniref:MFS transporter n=2 Tax=Metabacillus TaxID=2675233 RepID=A0A179T4W2_9BACI|nr:MULTISPECIES: MFS transporter [Metabacillus]OAS88318.1 MFS transporter [Metabacillus litoralis]QNF28044.1 MFS transporter [Metabacillus sp. KUDC1714]
MKQETSFKEFLGNRFVRAILLSGLFLQLGIWVRNFSVLLFVMEQTNEDPFAVSMISVAEFAPIFIFSIIGGTFADRWKPKKTMVWCDILSAISVFAVLLTLIFATWKVVFFAMLISSILSQFSQPSGMKLFKVHVPEKQLQMGMSIYQTMFALFMIIGPVIGTVVFQQYGIEVSIAITGVMFLLSAVALMFLPADKLVEKTDEQTTVLEEFVQGFKYVMKNRFLTILGANFFVAGLAVGLIQPLGIFIVTEQLQMDKEFVQWFMAINGIAMIIGGGIALALSKKVTPIRMLAAGMFVNALMISVIGFSEILWLTLIAQFFTGLMMPAIQISINTMILQNAEESFVGRVNGIMTPLFMGAMVLMMSLAGILKQQVGLGISYQVSAVCMVIGVILVLPLVLDRSIKKRVKVNV